MNQLKYIEWFDVEEMHEHSKEWFSELSFLKDEQQFLNRLVHSFALKPLDEKSIKLLVDFKKSITENQQRLISIFKQVQKHMNQLEILMDDIDQLEMEQAYRETHKKLFLQMHKYLTSFRSAKHKGFSNLTHLLKENKKIAIGNPEYKLRA